MTPVLLICSITNALPGLFKQSHSRFCVIFKEFPDEDTSLIKACKGPNPDIAMFLLKEGADPNWTGYKGEKGVVDGASGQAIKTQPLSLIRRLVKKGAAVETFQ